MVRIEEKDDIFPICPYCAIEIKTLICQKVEAFLGKRYVYFCPSCRKVLGVSHRKGFWMG